MIYLLLNLNSKKSKVNIKGQPPLKDDKVYAAYDVKTLFANISIQETINASSKRFMSKINYQISVVKLIFSRLKLYFSQTSTKKKTVVPWVDPYQ